ncbi:hypothetical protein Sste5346_009243 [Sporothrix stenoceras]|uniref:Uncharacterized protein n=1 Tax=Sporothrix stenoceras TaxID=5173 RepID=A0ABR3YMA3_9PEZI
MASKHEVFDSDDDGDDLSPLSSPLASPKLSPLPLPPIETETETTTTKSTNLAHATSTSTDPSFFRDVYEEQQRAIGVQLAPFPPGFDDSHHDILAERSAVERSSRDPWEVPSSPIEVAGQQLRSYLKRKREEGQANRQNAAVVVQLEDLCNDNAPAQAKKQRTDANIGGVAALETISIPLEPFTPSRLHQYPRMLSSSINEEPLPRQSISLDESLEAAPPFQQPPYEEILPPNEDVTQSTIAFTTPSVYASSGRRALGSSNNNSNSAQKQLKISSNNMDIVKEEEVVMVAQDSTPTRRTRNAADMAQILSSPDIIAEPTSRESPRHQSPLPEEDEDPEEDEEGGVEWGSHRSREEMSTAEATRPQSAQWRSSIVDELSTSIDVPVQSEAVQEVYEPDASCDLLKEKRPSKPKKKSPKKQKKKAVFIAASDDEDEDIIVSAAPPVQSESDFSDVPVKSKPTAAKGKRGPKKKTAQEVLSVELSSETTLPTKAKRGRGRPKRQKTPPQVIDSDDEEVVLVQGAVEDDIEIKIEPSETKTDEYTAAPDSDADSEAEPDLPTPDKTKGKKGNKASAKDTEAGRGRKSTKVDAANAVPSQEAVEEKTVFSNTSGNASAASSFKVVAEDKQVAQKTAVVAKKEKPAPILEDSKPALSTTGPGRALLNTGLVATASQGKIPYRVGLSKKFRIAPLLKMIRK